MEDELSEEEHAAQLTARQRQEFEDQQNELMGNETGRQARFLGGANNRMARIKKEREERAFRDALALLLQDPEYRALYEELGNKLGEAEQHADQVIADLQADLADLQREINQMLDAAPQLPNGARVFRFADGRVIDEHGQEIAPEIAEGIIWPPGAPSAEDYLANRDRELALNDLLEQWQGYRNDTLGGIRDRYDDRENPISKGDLSDLATEIETVIPSITTITPPSAEHGSAPIQTLSALSAPTQMN